MGGLVAVFGLNAQSTAVRHQRFTGPSPPAPLRTKATTKHTDESQMSRQSSKKPSRPQRQRIRNTHTTDDRSRSVEEERETEGGESVPLCREMRICGRLLHSSACLMSVCGKDREEARMHRRMDRRTPELKRAAVFLCQLLSIH